MGCKVLKTFEQIELLLSRPKHAPTSLNVKTVAIEAYDHLRCHHYIPEADALVNLLAKPHVKSLLLCHDVIAKKAYVPVISEIPYEVDEDSVNVKVVSLIKQHEPLGVTIKFSEHHGAVSIARVMHGGAADRSVAIDPGDEIQEINGVAVRGRDPMKVIRMLTTKSGDVKLKLTPSLTTTTTRTEKELNQVYVRTMFSYSPTSDPLIPCPEAGLSFLKGEILQLTNLDDPNWWQAVKVEFALNRSVPALLSNTGSQLGVRRAGLIPSKDLKEWRNQYRGVTDKELGDSVSYEEVERYFPERGFYRPIVLVVTTRNPQPSKMHGVDFMLVTEEEFNTFVEAESLIDQVSGSNEGEMTGLCLDAVLEIIQAGKVAVFEIDFRSLQQIRSATLKPFVIFIKPPSLEVLMETRQMQPSRLQSDRDLVHTTSCEHSPIKSVPTTPKFTGLNRSPRPLESTTPLRHTRGLGTSKNDDFTRLGSKVTASLDRIQIMDQPAVSFKLNVSKPGIVVNVSLELLASHTVKKLKIAS
ncbi:MAGUK p55 subfamily member 7 [Paragonimus heterotremus]|uniref:MAGUK p55 subfamily member 7 n=1 Tax=Paragonimus heterotremus TaxID=100268 RepID=A0A8J4SLW8_9TREM|nr:MAGUK p55 subfamily member 7 [Paragonimus heterotremus]